MSYLLDTRVRFTNESEYQSLYEWSLQEIDHDGTPITPNLIPWYGIHCFLCDDLRYSWNIESEFNWQSRGLPELKERQLIRGSFYPEDAHFSFFGTSRMLSNFDVLISMKDDLRDESCSAWGSISSSYEIDFVESISPDCLQINISINKEQFDALKDLVLIGTELEANLKLYGVRGFYAQWTPLSSADDIKVLASLEDQAVEIPMGNDIEIPILGKINKFNLQVSQKSKKSNAVGNIEDSE